MEILDVDEIIPITLENARLFLDHGAKKVSNIEKLTELIWKNEAKKFG